MRSGDGILSFRLRLTPKGGRDAIEGWVQGGDGDYLKARVAAPPEDGKANAALLALLAQSLDIAKSTIKIRRGASARLKTIEISPATPAMAARLEAMECIT